MRKQSLTLIAPTVLAFVFFINITVAFDGDGHKAIEKRAYVLLGLFPGDPAHGIPPGKEILKYLLKKEVLAKKYPYLRSHFPDLSLERQFAQNRQMYHFMASNHDVVMAAKENSPDARKQKLLVSALGPCLKMMYFFFRELIFDHKKSSEAGRGIYVLMHIIEDSYSSEHSTRDKNSQQLITIKGWQLSRLWWRYTAKKESKGGIKDFPLLHRGHCAKGDHEWFDFDTDSKLSAAADSAAYAVRDLLIITYMALKEKNKPDELISKFFEDHFKPVVAIVIDRKFIIQGEKPIPLSYDIEFTEHPKRTTYDYDRFPSHAFMGGVQQRIFHFTKRPGYEFFYSKFFSPKHADKPGTLLQRLSYGANISASYLPEFDKDFSEEKYLRLKTCFSFAGFVPILGEIDPKIGMGFYPFREKKRLALVYGFNMIWIIGKDFGIAGFANTKRLSFGYEHDGRNPFAKAMFIVKFGINSWHGRVVFKKKLRINK